MIDDVARCRRLFGLDRPAAEETALAGDPLLAGLIRARPGLRVPGAWDPFETSVRVLLGQQVSVAGASTLAGRLVEAFGTRVAGLGEMGLTHTFPAATQIAAASIERLRGIGLPEARARALREFALAYAEERVRLDPAAPFEVTMESLLALPGIGPWTAQMIALRACGQPDAFASGDLGLRRKAARLRGEAEPMAAEALEALAGQWRPHRALAAMHLWMAS